MKKAPVYLILTVLIFVSSPGISQIRNLSFSLGGNCNSIPSVTKKTVFSNDYLPSGYYSLPSYSAYEVRTSYDSKPGISGAFAFNVPIGGRFHLASGLNFDQYRYSVQTSIRVQQHTADVIYTFEGTTQGTPFGSFYGYQIDDVTPGSFKLIETPLQGQPSKKDETHISYISVPVMVGTSFFRERLSLEAGFSLGVLMRVANYKTGYTFTYEERLVQPWRSDAWGGDGEPILTTVVVPHEYRYKTTRQDGYESFMVSSMVRASYSIFRHFGVTASSQLYLTPIAEKQAKAKYKTVSLGLMYRL